MTKKKIDIHFCFYGRNTQALTKQPQNSQTTLTYFQLLSTPINGVRQQVQVLRAVLLLLLPLEAPGVGVLQPLGQGQEGRLGVLPPAPRERVRLLPREGAHAQALPAAGVARAAPRRAHAALRQPPVADPRRDRGPPADPPEGEGRRAAEARAPRLQRQPVRAADGRRGARREARQAPPHQGRPGLDRTEAEHRPAAAGRVGPAAGAQPQRGRGGPAQGAPLQDGDLRRGVRLADVRRGDRQGAPRGAALRRRAVAGGDRRRRGVL